MIILNKITTMSSYLATKKVLIVQTLTACLFFVTPAIVQAEDAAAPAVSPTEAYTVYHEAAVEAKALKDIEPYSSAATVTAMAAYVPEQRKAIFEMHKATYENSKDFKVLSESIDGSTSAVIAKFCGSNGRVNDIKATLLLEAGLWKVDLVSYASGADPC